MNGRALRRLARLYGVQTSYYDIEGSLRRASDGALLDVLRALGENVGEGDVAAALDRRRLALRRRGLPPVVVAWEGRLPTLTLRRPHPAHMPPSFRVMREDGGEDRPDASVRRAGVEEVAGERFAVDRVRIAGTLPAGYHRLEARTDAGTSSALVISAPRRCYDPGETQGRPWHAWGAFLPLYALRTRSGGGIGTLGELDELARWIGGRGGRALGTLPLLATYLDEPFEPSPYSPASRLFWNDVYVDVTRAPELGRCPPAQALLASGGIQRAHADRRQAEEVDWAAEHDEKRRLLQLLADRFFEDGGDRSEAYLDFLARSPEAGRWARFRATMDARGGAWTAWPEELRQREGRELRPGDYRERDRRRHVYAQYLLDLQLRRLAESARDAGVRLYLDMPIGVHADAYDAWANPELFARGMSAGAPPDPFIAKGQDWGFRPIRPDTQRASGYAYAIACLRAHLRYAGALRLDHVMSLHRLFWVPEGREPVEGVYVRYCAEEMFAILALESQRAGAVIVGEDLGTVPRSVRAGMERHGVRGMYVAEFAATGDPGQPLSLVPAGVVASLNTHDMPPFAGFLTGADIAERLELGWLDVESADAARRERAVQVAALRSAMRREGLLDADADDAPAVARAVLVRLALSDAGLVLVNLEDLWGETRPQNIPGTWRERPNWRRRAALTLAEMREDPRVAKTLDALRARMA